MPGERRVIDASVVGSAFFEEADTAMARSFLAQDNDLIAPSLLVLEIASIAAKKVWKGLATSEVTEKAVSTVRTLVKLEELTDELIATAFRLARDERYSVYDATYLALAMREEADVVTLDAKLVARAQAAGHQRFVTLLDRATS